MKKMAITIVVILLVAIVGILLIRFRQQNTDVTKDTTKVGFLMSGAVDDQGWCQSHYEGMEKAAVSLNLEVDYRENVQLTQCQETVEDLISDGCTIIISNNSKYNIILKNLAKDHEEVTFLTVDNTDTSENFGGFDGRIYQIRYLCGIVAGMQTQTNAIGYVAKMNTPETIRGINAFTLGVRSANPDATVYVEWSGYEQDYDQDKRASSALFSEHPQVDVMAAETDTLAPYDYANSRGVALIGIHEDNYNLYPDTMLASAVWNWDVYYTEEIRLILQNKFTGDFYWEGMDTGLVTLSPLTNITNTQTEPQLAYAEAQLENGSWDVFLGPVTDNSGKLRIGQGEMITDAELLDGMNWYVEGVVVCHENEQ